MLLKVAKLLKVVAADTGGSDGCSGVVLEPWILLQLDEYLQRARCIVVDGDASSLLPRHAHGKFLRMFLGPINVRASRKDVQLKDYKYVRILGAFYLQLTGSDTDVYHYLEPLYNDYRKLRRKLADGRCGFQTKQKYRFGWFSMKLKLVGGDSAGVVTTYYMCSENGAGPTRDEIDFEFLNDLGLMEGKGWLRSLGCPKSSLYLRGHQFQMRVGEWQCGALMLFCCLIQMLCYREL
ncbi:uncharacterized protein LOC131651233 isoform X3 [Vicia villosa]|nr:uncharacterized protein LOC131651233 isoform X3 [Vicia villosa]XP_058776887.1 uncharacterized protein LOC131651233 isoform X3 [Vicia villosa]